MALAIKKEPFTYHDLDNFPEDGVRREIIAGDLFVSAAPSTRHQRLISELHGLIWLFLRGNPIGTVFMAPTQVIFDDLTSVEPDIFVVLKDGRAQVTERRVVGAPAWVIEVLSPSNRDYDLETKRKLYASQGTIYWVVDPEAEEMTVWDTEGKQVYQRDDVARVSVLPEFEVGLADLFDAVV